VFDPRDVTDRLGRDALREPQPPVIDDRQASFGRSIVSFSRRASCGATSADSRGIEF